MLLGDDGGALGDAVAIVPKPIEEERLLEGPTDYGPPVGYWAFIRDPDGHTLEVSHGQDVGLAVERA